MPQGNNLVVTGWAADAEDGSPVERVEIRIDGAAVGDATLNLQRPDVVDACALPDFLSSGWTLSVPTDALTMGAHTAAAVAIDSGGLTTGLDGTAAFTVVFDDP